MIKSIDLGNFSQVAKDEELAVRMQCGYFSTRTSYVKESTGHILVNEKFVIDLDNDRNQQLDLFVDKIGRNNLKQFEKDSLDAETIADAVLKSNAWPTKSRSIKIETTDEGHKSDIVIHAEAFFKNQVPSKGIYCL